jgi:hypothetical protein
MSGGVLKLIFLLLRIWRVIIIKLTLILSWPINRRVRLPASNFNRRVFRSSFWWLLSFREIFIIIGCLEFILHLVKSFSKRLQISRSERALGMNRLLYFHCILDLLKSNIGELFIIFRLFVVSNGGGYLGKLKF